MQRMDTQIPELPPERCGAPSHQKVCRRCGGLDFYPCGVCKKCNYERQARKHLENPEQRKERWAKYRAEHLEQLKAKDKKLYTNNPDKIRKKSSAYREKNRVILNKKTSEWTAKNKDKKRNIDKRWREHNKVKMKISEQNRRAAKKNRGGALSKDLPARLFVLQRGKCACCKKPLGDDFQMDHKIPLVRGGSNTDDNIQLLRKRCNLQKGGKDPIEFMQSRGFLL
jgi:hypothetical protein